MPIGQPLVWRYAISQLIEHLKFSEAAHATQIAEKCVREYIDTSSSIIPWFGGITLTEKDIFHLKNLNNAINRTALQVVHHQSEFSCMTDFACELKNKLSQIRHMLK